MAVIASAVHMVWVSVLALALLFLLSFPLLWRLINFAEKNPQAALFEGAEFLAHEQMQLGMKTTPVFAIPRTSTSRDCAPRRLKIPEQQAIRIRLKLKILMALYHIYIKPKAGVTMEQVEKTLNLAQDWYRYRDGCYVVQTTSDENKWFARLNPFVEPSGFMFICKFNPRNYHGWMEQTFWDWFQPKANQEITRLPPPR